MKLHNDGTWANEIAIDEATWCQAAMRLVPCDTTGPIYPHHPWHMTEEQRDILRRYYGHSVQPNPSAF